MSGESTRNRDGCAGIRELVAWHATGTLDAADARRVEDHLAGCTACSALLSFTRDLKSGLAEVGESHPRSNLLVAYSERSADLRNLDRAAIERHVGECEPCARLVAILEAVNESEAGPEAYVRGPSGGWLRSLWARLSDSVLRPAPAAVYLAVAAVAVAVLIARLAERPDGGESKEGARIGTVAGRVILLPDRTEIGRGGFPQDEEIPSIDAVETRFLLLEFLELEAPPDPNASYRVSFIREGETRPAWETTVHGSLFAETLSLCVLLQAGALGPGLYDVAMVDPSGATIYRSALEVR